MSQTASTYIRRLTDDGQITEVTEVLEMSQTEFDQITSTYGTGKRTTKKQVHHSDALSKAQAAVFPDEELTEENFDRVDTDGFEKAVVLLKHWADMAMREMFKKRNFRIEINYNAEERKTSFAIYTPTEAGKADIQQEHSDS